MDIAQLQCGEEHDVHQATRPLLCAYHCETRRRASYYRLMYIPFMCSRLCKVNINSLTVNFLYSSVMVFIRPMPCAAPEDLFLPRAFDGTTDCLDLKERPEL